MMAEKTDEKEISTLHARLDTEAEAGGYHLNPDHEFTRELAAGLLVNEKRYGYQACPCRLASGRKEDDLDIICPCDYRDSDLDEFGACYCGLYVSDQVLSGARKLGSIPERRPAGGRSAAPAQGPRTAGQSVFPLPVWRCRVCGYLCGREEAPLVCPVCKAKKDRFERFA